MKNRMRTERTGRGFLPALLLAAVLLFQPAAGLTVRAQEQPQTAAGTQTAEIQTDNFSQAAQTDISAQNAQEAAAAAQAQADALMAAHLAAWQQAKEEYAAQLAAYQQALAAQQAAAASQTETAARQQAETAQAAVQQTEEAQTAAQQQTGIAAQTDAAAASQDRDRRPGSQEHCPRLFRHPGSRGRRSPFWETASPPFRGGSRRDMPASIRIRTMISRTYLRPGGCR